MRRTLVAGLLAAVAAAAVLAAAGTAGAQADAASLAAIVDETQTQLGQMAAVQEADNSTNLVRGAGGLVGLGLGVALGSVVTYFQWRR